MAKNSSYFGSGVFILVLLLCSFLSIAQVYEDLYPVYKGASQGFVNKDGKLIVDFIYAQGYGFGNGYAVVNRNMKRGLIDTKGKEVLPIVYSELTYWKDYDIWEGTFFPDSLVLFKLNGETLYAGRGHSALAWAEIDRIAITTNVYGGVQPFKCFLINFKGKKIAEIEGPANIQYGPLESRHSMNVTTFSKKYLAVGGNNYQAIAGMNGKILIDSVSFMGFQDGEMVLMGNNKAALVDTNLKELIPFGAGYKMIVPMYGTPYYNVQKDTLWAVVDRNNNILVDFIFNNRASTKAPGMFEVYNPSTRVYGYYKYDGEKIFESANMLYMGEFQIALPVEKKENEYQLWKNKFIGNTYEYISYFGKEGYAYFYDKGESGLLDTNGNEVLRGRFEQLSLPVDGIMAAGVSVKCPECSKYPCAQSVSSVNESHINQFYFVDMKGERLNKEMYDFLHPFRFGQALVSKNCRSYFVNMAGKDISGTNEYGYYSNYASGVRIVSNKQKQVALMDSTGKVISVWVSSFNTKEGNTLSYHLYEGNREHALSIATELLPDFNKGVIQFRVNDKAGLMDSTGKVIIPAQYNTINPVGKYIIVSKEKNGQKQMGVVDYGGKIMVPIEYADVQYHYITASWEKSKGAYYLFKTEDGLPVIFKDE